MERRVTEMEVAVAEAERAREQASRAATEHRLERERLSARLAEVERSAATKAAAATAAEERMWSTTSQVGRHPYD
jgi:uncharacterized coiled-coil protein SlyX